MKSGKAEFRNRKRLVEAMLSSVIITITFDKQIQFNGALQFLELTSTALHEPSERSERP